MDDLLGLSWEQKTTGSAGTTATGIKSSKPPPPPPTSKPIHLQMGLSKSGLVPTPAPLSAQPYRNNNTMGSSFNSSSSSMASSSSSVAPKKNADDIFGSLMPSFGQNAASDVSKNLNSMTLEERRRHDQQQSSLSSSPSFASPTPAHPTLSSSSLFSQASRSTFTPPINGASTASRGRGPENIAGLSRTTATPSPQPAMAFASPIPKLQQPQPFSQQQTMSSNPSRNQSPAGLTASPGALGRSLSPAMIPLQPERSNSASPSTATSTSTPKDPFGALLGDQISRSNPSLKNQSLNAIRYNTPPPGHSSSTPKAADPWDLDFLANAAVFKSSQPASTTASDVFDLGSFEKAPPEKPVRQRDSADALNLFVGKQPPPITAPSPKSSPPVSRKEPSAKSVRSSPATSTASTREDGDIAQIVAMGFTAEQAKVALEMTDSGRDIEAAIEYLVQNDEAEGQLPPRRHTPASGERRKVERQPYREDSDPPLEDRRRRNQGRGNQGQSQQELTTAQQLQQHRDKLMGTASVFGMSVLSKANEIYKQGREKVQAVMEDMTVEESRSTTARRHEWIEDEYKPGSGYKDSDSEDEVYTGRREQQREQEQRQQQQRRRQQQQQQHDQRQQPSSRPRQERETFEDTYVSSSRRGGASVSRNQNSLFSMDDTQGASKSKLSASAPSSRPAARSPSPLPPKPTRPPRVLVQAGSQQLTESNHFKEKGNEVFKLGQFGHAAEFYARASQALPSGHVLLIVTRNNRAAALLKIGEYRETVTECEQSILLIQGPDGQGVNDVLPASAGVNLKDQLGKALMRRATAYENLEKYKEAKDDWAKLRELEPGHRNATEGHRRCEKAIAMMNNGDDIPTVAKKSVSTSAAARSNGLGSTSSPMQDIFASHHQSNNETKIKADLNRSEGVSKLRQTAAQQEREEDEKLRLTDHVDMKMAMWKSGKEDNIRALLASLGSVLWEGAAWKPVGMHELVTPAQVKVKYMRAIAKMHPDKLNASTTVEQRMMANTIFSTLNAAWDAFKVQNNM
ncbi:hypothetical protein BC939DRAFT_478657 [Gamsiella multidivaricata]|uniref:uncharacterized protein n=1 Tax=Gamsiella multidivaricata TaxID=101098 RepID=UPI002220C620|nr:uncharacterized protein BC939DRAFT_478657 [Gamsiella multidivaricata]KAI7820778.1 hypothetical protein BC939DRAFT_478657 [Gamsiella multidivaricata]